MTQQPPKTGALWKIRSFEMSDYDAVRRLWEQAGPGLQLRPSDEREEIAKRCAIDDDLFLVAELDDTIVGVIMGGWDGRRGWLHHLTIDVAHGGRGIARSLVGAVEAALRARGCLKINLLVFEHNHSARELYRRLGYSEMHGILPMGKEL